MKSCGLRLPILSPILTSQWGPLLGFVFFAVALLLPRAVKAEPTDAAEPLFPGIVEIVLCLDDSDAKAKFGHPRKAGLSAGSLWCYVGNGREVKPFGFTDKEGRDGNWYSLIGDNSRYELVFKDMPAESPYCRIWRFNKKPKTLYWITDNVGCTEFELDPPHGAGPVNLAEHVFGPDPRIAAQWYLTFGKTRFQARAGDTNRVNWLVVDGDAFSPADFIAKCHGMIRRDLDRRLEAAIGELRRARENEGRAERLREERDKLQIELDNVDSSVKKAEEALRHAVREYEMAKKALARASTLQEREHYTCYMDDAAKRAARAKRELDEVNRRRGKDNADGLFGRVQSLDEEIRQLVNAPATAQAKAMAIEAEIEALPSVEEAQRQWTIHVKIDLGGTRK